MYASPSQEVEAGPNGDLIYGYLSEIVRSAFRVRWLAYAIAEKCDLESTIEVRRQPVAPNTQLDLRVFGSSISPREKVGRCDLLS
jgi:hypothetical protein